MTALPLEETYAEAAVKAISNGWLVLVQHRADTTWDFVILSQITGQGLGSAGPNRGRTFNSDDVVTVISVLGAAGCDVATFDQLVPEVQETIKLTVSPTEFRTSETWHQEQLQVWGLDLSTVAAIETGWDRAKARAGRVARVTGKVSFYLGTAVAAGYAQMKVEQKVLELLSPKPTVWQRMTGQKPAPFSVLPSLSFRSFRIGR